MSQIFSCANNKTTPDQAEIQVWGFFMPYLLDGKEPIFFAKEAAFLHSMG